MLAERRPPQLLGEVLGPHELLILEGRDARTFLVEYLELFQMPHPVIGDRGVEQVVLDVGQHQAGAVDREDGVGGLDDVMHRVLDPHLAEAQLAQLVQRVAYIMHRDVHLPAPNVCLIPATRTVRILPASQSSISQSASTPVSSRTLRTPGRGLRMTRRRPAGLDRAAVAMTRAEPQSMKPVPAMSRTSRSGSPRATRASCSARIGVVTRSSSPLMKTVVASWLTSTSIASGPAGSPFSSSGRCAKGRSGSGPSV